MDDKESILAIIYELLEEHWNLEPIRLLGVTVQDLLEKKYVVKQLSLFTYEEELKRTKMKQTIHQLKSKYGEETFKNWDTVNDNKGKLLRTSFQKDFLDDYKN